MTKLNWSFDSTLGCMVAEHNGYRIKAEREEHPANPFEDWYGSWPTLVYYDGSSKGYDKAPGPSVSNALDRFTAEALVHNQVHIAEALGTSIPELTRWHRDEATKYCWDAQDLRDMLTEHWSYVDARRELERLDKLYTILDIPHLLAQSTGYCQGDWAEVLVVATPEAQAEFGHDKAYVEELVRKQLIEGDVAPGITENVFAAHIAKHWKQQLEATVDCYSAWAWGDVYGYVVEKPIVDKDGEVEDWEEVDSCWGFYGTDFDESGLAEQALDAVPDEPAVPVREREDA